MKDNLPVDSLWQSVFNIFSWTKLADSCAPVQKPPECSNLCLTLSFHVLTLFRYWQPLSKSHLSKCSLYTRSFFPDMKDDSCDSVCLSNFKCQREGRLHIWGFFIWPVLALDDSEVQMKCYVILAPNVIIRFCFPLHIEIQKIFLNWATLINALFNKMQ